MAQFIRLFVVYDPTREEQPALQRAADIAKENSASVHIFACIHPDVAKSLDKANEITRLLDEQRGKLDTVAAALSDQGVEVITEVEWGKDWDQAAVRASIKGSADMVLKSSYRHSHGKRVLNRTADWTLMRECLCPVMLVKESLPREVPRVLAAIDICAKNDSYERLNRSVIDFGRQALNNKDAEVHFINAFQDFQGVPDRQELIRSCGIESEKIHIKHGKPEKVIVDQAQKMDASLVVVGNSNRSGVLGALVGNTVEKVLDKLECDVLSMP